MLPEERVRHDLINDLTGRLGFPKHLIVIEKEISQLPHLQGKKLPKRRIDLVCFTQKGDLLHPLLLVECKAIHLSEKVLQQVLGYNYYVQADFVAIANGQGVIMADRMGEGVKDGLLSYRELVGWSALSGV